ncbi:MAG: hypothetical protein ABIO55_08600 [Ginsengibacter sp.]
MKQYPSLLFLSLLIVIFFCFPYLAHAQPDPATDPDAPIDGGVGILIAAGIGYGLKKMRDEKRKKDTIL